MCHARFVTGWNQASRLLCLSPSCRCVDECGPMPIPPGARGGTLEPPTMAAKGRLGSLTAPCNRPGKPSARVLARTRHRSP